MITAGKAISQLFLGLAATAGCSSAPGSVVDDVGVARIALMVVPSDVECLRITAQGSRQVVDSFDLSPGTPASFEMAGLPFGDVRFSAEAFETACAGSKAATSATWVSEPVASTIAKGVVSQVTLVMRRNGRSTIAIDFNDCAEGLADLGSLSTAQDVMPVDMNEVGQVVGTTAIDAFLWEAGHMKGLGLGPGSGVIAINNRGQILALDPDAQPVLWSDAVVSRIQGLDGQRPNVVALNDAGQVVGESTMGEATHAIVWQAGVGAIDLGTLGGVNSRAHAINSRGQIVGSSDTEVGIHAFLWDAGTMRDLGSLGGFFSDATAINDAGQIIGTSYLANGDPRAFFWSGGSIRDLGTLGANWTMPVALAATGQVAGLSDLASGETHAFLWDAGYLRDLGTLGGVGSTLGGFRSINDAGEIVGSSETTLGELHAFVWDGAMHDLGTLGVPNTVAVGINRVHQIFGYSYTSSSRQHGFFFDPGRCPVAP